ncbi:Lrp/AsnC family transcriptional regulator [Paludibacterium paludis]|uniref:AsnC family transcriptional regulator n=1 Tax=Paludibacterium paludis TaxID=1225769 RepID=A0A918P239_9NEIS|nr:Lrp/AsnC family transcriptional regulator [Paludibacterium paludis]GGY13686.1 AsnC family transcriptional regulator [Paludibacterium paludis]
MNQENPRVDLDDLDRRLIEVLRDDASLTNQALAEKVFASPPTCLRRVRRLKDIGVIRKVTAQIDRRMLGPELEAIVEITLDRQDSDALAAFEARMAGEGAVVQCWRVSPGPDFVMIVSVTDMPAYHALSQRVFAMDANVRNVRAFFAIHRSKPEYPNTRT